MQTYMFAAGVLALIVGLVHSVLGVNLWGHKPFKPLGSSLAK